MVAQWAALGQGRAMRLRTVLVAAASLASPAWADHVGPSGGGGSSNVISPDTLDEGKAALGFRLTYSRPERRSGAELATLAGQHVHAHNTDYNLNASASFAYGVTHELTVSAELPYVVRQNLREGFHSDVNGQVMSGVEQLGTVQGIGDASLLARYKLLAGHAVTFAIIGGVKLPTGSTHQLSEKGERLETEHQPGTGSFDPVAGAAIGTKLGKLRLVGSGLYQFAGMGAQNTRLGDRAQVGFALSHHFGEEEHHEHGAEDDHHDDDEHQHAALRVHQSWDAYVELTGEWEGRQKVDGPVEAESGGKALWFTPGARFNTAQGLSFGAALGVPVAQHIRASHPENRARLTLSVGRAF